MLKYNYDTKVIEAYKLKCEYFAYGKNIVSYFDTEDDIKRNIAENFNNATITPVVLTEEETKRLNEFNLLKLEYKQNYIYDAINFVVDGICLSNNENLKELKLKCDTANRKYLALRLSKEVVQLRNDKINGGVTVYGSKFDSDQAAEINLNSVTTRVLKLKEKGGTDESIVNKKIAWKLYDNTHKMFSLLQLSEVGDVIANNKSISYFAEGLVMAYLENLTVEELTMFKTNAIYNPNMQTDIENTENKTIEYKELKPIFDSLFIEAEKEFSITNL